MAHRKIKAQELICLFYFTLCIIVGPMNLFNPPVIPWLVLCQFRSHQTANQASDIFSGGLSSNSNEAYRMFLFAYWLAPNNSEAYANLGLLEPFVFRSETLVATIA